MAAVTMDLTLEQGATKRVTVTWRSASADVGGVVTPGDPFDLTGATARMQIRRRRGGEILLELTTENGGLVLGGVLGTIAVHASAEQTDLLTYRRGVYDLEVVFPSGDVFRVLQGAVAVNLNITRDPGGTNVV